MKSWKSISLAVILTLGVLTVGSTGQTKEPGHVGYKLCSACHKYQRTQWETTTHYTASEPLSDEQKADPACMSCHGTGAEQGNIGEKWENVQCEACHGPGKKYVKMKAKWKKEPEATKQEALKVGLRLQKEESCLQCHSSERPEGHPPAEPFDYEEAYKKVAHIEE